MDELTELERLIIVEKGTEPPFSGQLNDKFDDGLYRCRQRRAPLYLSEDKFDAFCGWPSFDNEIKNSIARKLDKDGVRVEISCSGCGGHLGHVFEGEQLTANNVRHCVNSTSLIFESKYLND